MRGKMWSGTTRIPVCDTCWLGLLVSAAPTALVRLIAISGPLIIAVPQSIKIGRQHPEGKELNY